MASKGGVGHRPRRRAACRCARPTWSPSRSWSPSRRSGCSASASPARVDEVLAVCATLGGPRHGDRRGHRHRARCASSAATSSSATCRSRRSSTTARSTTSRPQRPTRAALRRRRRRRSRRGAPVARGAARAAGARPTSPRAGRCSSSTTAIVQSRTVRRPEEADAAVLALPDGGALGVSIDGNGRRVAADPYRGTIAAVLECAANLACVGAEPLGVTNNLNFGNPEKPHIAWQLTEAVRGLGDACRALDVPVVGGNVSLYNEGADAARSTRRRSSAWSAGCPTRARAGRLGLRARGRRDRARRLGRARRRWPASRAGQAARRAAARRPARRRPRRRRARCSRRSATRCAPATLSSLPRRRRGRLPGRGRRVLPGRRPRRDARPRAQRRPVVRSSSASGPAASSSRARATRSTRSAQRVPLDVFGDGRRRRARAHDRRRDARAGRSAELREAHGALGRFFP